MEQWLDRERDQLVLWVPVALGCGIAAWFVIPFRDGWIALILGLLAGAIAVMAILPAGRLRRGLILFQLLMIGGSLLIWWRAEHVAAPRLERPRVVQLTARIETVEQLAARDVVRLTLAPDAGQDLPMRIRVNVKQNYVSSSPSLRPGMSVRVRARLMPPAAAALPGAYDFQQVAWFRRLGATGTALGLAEPIGLETHGGFMDWVNSLRTRLTTHVQQKVGGSAGGIAASLVTGDQGGISEEDVQSMRVSGLAHLLSISGLHVGAVVAGTMLLALRLLALSPALALRAPLPVIAASAAAIAGIAYTLLAGAEVPTVRSCIAALLILIALALGREAITLRLVAAGALTVLLLWPEAIVSPSFQLSFAAVTALVAFHEHPRVKAFARHGAEDGVVRRTGRSLLLLFLTGLVIEAALTPIALYHFHRAGVYGSLANMIAIPLTTFVIMPIEFIALLLDTAGLGDPFWIVLNISINILINISYFVQNQPGSLAIVPTMPSGAFAIMLGSGLWLCLWRGHVRWYALPVFLGGIVWAVSAPSPDLLVTGDGRHVAIRGPDKRMHLLRPRTGDYVRDMIAGVAAERELAVLDVMPGTRCNADLCVADVAARERDWRLAATRSPYFVPWKDMTRTCAEVDIVISDRRLPAACKPRWMKADRPMLEQTGGLAIYFDPLTVKAVRSPRDDHPWLRINPASYPR